MKHKSVLISGAANTVSHSCVWIKFGNISCVAYALHNVIAITDVHGNNVVCTLRSHSTKIIAISSCMRDNCVELYSGADDGSVHCWTHHFGDNLTIWQRGNNLIGLKSALTALTSLISSNKTLVAASDSQGSLILWSNGSQSQVIDSLRLPPAQMAYSLCLSALPNIKGEFISLFVGCVDARIHLYVANVADFIDRTSGPVFRSVGALVGHEEWITCLSSVKIDDRTIMVASGSQDSKIRVWKIVVQASATTSSVTVSESNISTADDDNEGEDIQEDDAGPVAIVFEEEEALSEARLQFGAGEGQSYAVFLDALLVGHEDWVTSLTWMPSTTKSSSVRLFSTSMDRNMVIWASDESAGGIWIPSVRVGDIGGSLGGSVGGNLLGFVGGCMSPDCRSILGIGYGGSFHLWSRTKQLINNKPLRDVSRGDRIAFAAEMEAEERWYPIPFLSGHFGSVNDLAWCPTTGNYVMSVSADQTCRLYSSVTKLNVCIDNEYDFANASKSSTQLWKEVSRPQIHGYDMNCIALLPDSCVIFTGGEEKVIRVFDAPNAVLVGLEKLCGVVIDGVNSSSRIEQAYIPELGLSNKALDTMSSQEKKEQEARSVSSIDWRFHPLEGQLADHTLWPEIKKMFGHSNDVMCMSLSSNGLWLASANKARDANSAQVLLWNASSKELVTKLTGHESTVVCVQFSPNNKYLASSGKDRNLLLYKNEGDTFNLCTFKKAAHKRIVWDLSWTSDSTKLVTVSRDGICKVWRISESPTSVDLESIYSYSPCNGVSITALDVLSHSNSWLVAFGAENGDIIVDNISEDGKSSTTVTKVESIYCHGTTVRRIRWRPSNKNSSNELQFATCGEDNTVRIHELIVN